MKCPHRTITTTKHYHDGQLKASDRDVTTVDFMECLGDKCPCYKVIDELQSDYLGKTAGAINKKEVCTWNK